MSSAEPDNKKTPPKTLACKLCKQRRVKCNRSFPCTNCVRAGAACVQPAARLRRRRFAERELLDRVHRYEGLLRENGIAFESLHGYDTAIVAPEKQNSVDTSPQERRGGSKEDICRNIWQTMKRVALKDDGEDEESDNSASSYEAVDQHVKRTALAHDHLLFGAPDAGFDLTASHPDQVHIFKLWQVYLDNVDSLLKVTHAPTLQPRMIDAAGDITHIDTALEALMFSIYCVAIMSLAEDECLASFSLSRDYLLLSHQVACKQALLRCGPWRSNSLDCLTALYLYLVSISQQVDPRSLACMIAVAIRIAKRIGIHRESSSGHSALAAETGRRLWWALTQLDHRVCEITNQERSTSLTPDWDCHLALNANDFELREDMKRLPVGHEGTVTEALFVVVRSELADFIRHSSSIAALPGLDDGGLLGLEKLIEERYLTHCNPDIPLHSMTIWTARSFFARSRLTALYFGHAKHTNAASQASQADVHALTMLECDTQLRTSHLTKGYLWLVESCYSPVLAYFHILNGLAKRPDAEHADGAWKVMNDHYLALIDGPKHHRTRLMFALKFSDITAQAWGAREEMLRESGRPVEVVPPLVQDARARVAERESGAYGGGPGTTLQAGVTPGEDSGSSTMSYMFPTPTDFGGDSSGFGFPRLDSPGLFPDMTCSAYRDMSMDPSSFNWV